MKLPFVLPSDCKQRWYSMVKEVKNPVTNDVNLILINRYNLDDILNAYAAGAITDRDILMLRYLVRHKFGTAAQIAKACYHNKDTGKIKKRLSRFVKYQILDAFTWESNSQINGLIIYCLGPGGFRLLKSLNPDIGGWWSRHQNIRPMHEVMSFLVANEFSLKLSNDSYEFKAEPYMKFSNGKLKPTAAVIYRDSVFLLVVIRNDDMFNNFKSSLPVYNSFIEGRSWSEVYTKQPILIIIAESDDMALSIGNYINNSSTLQRFRFTTDERIMFRPFQKAFFTIENGLFVEKVAKIFDLSH